MSVRIGTFENTDPETGEQKLLPWIELKGDNSKYAFTFGMLKARLIVENYDEIQQFVADNSKRGN